MRTWTIGMTSLLTFGALTLLAGPHVLRSEIQALTQGDNPAAQSSALLALAIAATAWAAAGWLMVLYVLRLGALLPGATGSCAAALSARLTPRLVRGAVRVGVTATAGLGITGQFLPIAAQASPLAVSSFASDTCAGALDVSLDRAPEPCVPTATPIGPSPPDSVGGRQERIVRPGDTLWSIAVEELAATDRNPPSAQAIADRWPSWWSANRDVIGSNPALLHPGQILRAPTAPEPEE